MDPRTQRTIGTVLVVVGWTVVAVGATLVAVGLTGGGGSRDAVAGLGLAVVMGGLYLVLWANYVHHRALRRLDAGPATADRRPDTT